MANKQIDEALDRILERAHTYELHRHPSVKNLDGLSNDIALVRQALERQREMQDILRQLLYADGDHMTACDRIMGATHPCTCGADEARKVLQKFSPKTG